MVTNRCREAYRADTSTPGVRPERRVAYRVKSDREKDVGKAMDCRARHSDIANPAEKMMVKSKALIEDSDAEAAGGQNATSSPTLRPRTRSASRGRPAAGIARTETEQTIRRTSGRTTKSHKVIDEDVDMEVEKPAKRRKTVG